MGDDSENFQFESGERSLIEAAWEQFEALSEKHKSKVSDVQRSFDIPGYRVLREIHRGGQGIVFQAMQESTLRKVAIKVLKEGPLADPAELARFDREVEVLSRLNHPHIVAIHDRGVTASGLAFCVMDYIPGRALDAYVAGAALPVRAILDLFSRICDAVNVAHLRGITHRDLKPSNIRIDEEGQPHVLDFGLAKLTREAGSRQSTMTASGQFIGSLPWASPEQVEGRSDQLDIRTDVYSLGVILYQLLTRSFPYPVSGRIDEVVRHIIQVNPARPSTLRRDLDRDVEVVLLKCLAKDPERRYQSAGEVARDVHRYLNGEMIEARPATSLYQLRQFARRNKALVTSVVAIMVVLATATTVSVAFALREAAARDREHLALGREIQQRERADREAIQTRAVADFQARMLAGIDPQSMGVNLRADLFAKVRTAAERSGRKGDDVDARIEELEKLIAGIDLTGLALTALNENVFQRALTAIDEQFADQPLVRAQLQQTLASTLQGVGLFDAATAPQEAALALRQRVLGDEHPDTLVSMNGMGGLLRVRGKLPQAEAIYRDVLEMRRRVLGEEHPDTLESINNIARLSWDQGKLDQAEAYYREALEKRRRVLGEEHPDTLTTIGKTGGLLRARGKLSEAEPYCLEALEKRRRVLGEEHPDTLIAIGNMASLLKAQGKLVEAETYCREALEKSRRVRGDAHPDTLTLIGNLGGLCFGQGRLSQAEMYWREALEMRRLVLGDEHLNTLGNINNLGVALRAQGRLSEAEPYCREAIEKSRRVLGDKHPETLTAIDNMGSLLRAQGKLLEAEPYYREALEKSRIALGDLHHDTLISITNLGGVLGAQGKDAEAIGLLVPAELAARQAFAGSNASRLAHFLTALGCARVNIGEFEAAETNLNDAYSILSEAKNATERDRKNVLACLATLYDAWNSAEPDPGHEAKAVEWRAQLQEASSRP